MSVRETSLAVSANDSDRMVEVQRLAQRGPLAVDALVDMLTERSWVVRRAVVATLARIGTKAVPALAEALRDRTNEARLAAAVEALVGSVGDVEPHLLGLTDSSANPAVVCDVVQVLGRRGSRASIPVLSQLTKHADDNVAVAAIEALGRLGGPATIEPLLDAVKSGHFFRTFPAISALGQSGDPRATEPLAALLEDTRYVSEAASAIARTGNLSAVLPLARALLHGDPVHTTSAAHALFEICRRHADRTGSYEPAVVAVRGAVSERAAPKLWAALEVALPVDQIAIASVLAWLGDARAIRLLVERLDGEALLTESALRALASLGPDADPHLQEALRTADGSRRAHLLPLLAARRAALPELMLCLDDGDPAVRALACDALGRIGDPSAVEPLFALIGDRDVRVAHAAIAAIQSLGSVNAKRHALQAAGSTDTRVRRSALRIISYFAYPDAIDVLLGASSDPDERIGSTALAGLALLEDPRASEALVTATRHPSASTRAAACRALSMLGASAEVVSSLRQCLADPDAWVRYYACQSLGRLSVFEAAAEVSRLLHDEAGQVRVAAVEAMAKLGGQHALGVLKEALRSNDADVRRAALVGLGEIRRPEVFPVLLAELDSKDPGTRLVALSSIAAMNTSESTTIIMRSASDPDESVRTAAIGLAATRGGAATTDFLIERLSSSERDAALAALAHPVEGRIEGVLLALESANETLSDLLIRALLGMRSPAANAAVEAALRLENVHARRAAARGLFALGTPAARTALSEAAVADSDSEVRRMSAAVRA